ncbi:MAG: ATP-binding protein [Chloroherpetonaceae bacterium]
MTNTRRPPTMPENASTTRTSSPRLRLGVKVTLAQALILSVAIVLPAVLNFQNQKEETLKHLQEQLQTAANALALEINPSDFAKLSATPSDTLLPEYKRIHDKIARFTKANRYLGFDDDNVYAFRWMARDTMRFAVMFYSQYIGTPYKIRPEMEYAFQNRSSSYTGIYEDENGVWVSAYSPILDSTGVVLGLIEVDFKNNFYLLQLSEKQRSVITTSLIAVIFGAVLSFLLAFLITKPIQRITDAVLAFSRGDKSQRVEPLSNDEIGDLASAFNAMAEEISKRDRITEEIRKQRLEETIAALNQSNKELGKKQKELERTIDALNQSNEQIKAQQLQLLQAEKMSSLGQMVAGIAHEVNTPLGFVKNSLTLLSRNQQEIESLLEKQHQLAEALVDGDAEHVERHIAEAFEAAKELDENEVLEDSRKMLEHSKIGIERIEELVINLKNFSRLDESAFKLSDINEGIDSTLVIAHNAIKHKAEIIKDYAPDLKAECYPSQLNQVFLNLIMNAAQAIQEKGTIKITTQYEAEPNVIANEKADRKYAVIKIADSGKGISPEHLNKIFDPFFTTKPVGQGTGLGLSISYQIIERHKGAISVKSELGKGTEFTVRIPVRQSIG